MFATSGLETELDLILTALETTPGCETLASENNS